MKLLAAAVIAFTSCSWSQTSGAPRLAARPLQDTPHRVGVNLGLWTSWGAEQLSSNILKNPGFEPVLDRAIVIVRNAGTQSFTDDTDWVTRQPGFWTGGMYSVRTGALAGQVGKIAASANEGGFTRIDTQETVSGLKPGDVVALTHEDMGDSPTQWWIAPLNSPAAHLDRSDKRPGSNGVSSLRLAPQNNVIWASSYLDAIGSRAGKLLPLTGAWELKFWARSDTPAAHLQVVLRRAGAPAFLNQSVILTPDWQLHTLDISPADNGPAGLLELRFEATGAGSIWLDDVALRSLSDTGAFRAPVEAALHAIHPGYLRDWQGQLGDTFANRIADAGSRRPSRYRPGGAEATDYAYSLADFLDICSRLQAQPWVVLSPALSDDEWQQAGRYLAAAARSYSFEEIVVEFGNENWNAIFRPAGIPQAAALIEASTRAFKMLAKGAAGDPRLIPAVGGQMFSGSAIAPTAPGSIPALGPYWTYQFNPAAGSSQLFADYRTQFQTLALTGGSIYEMNAHTLSGGANVDDVNTLVTSAPAGAAMAWQALSAISAGVSRQCAWSLSGYDAFDANQQLVQLFGLTRDLAGDFHPRTTGKAIEMVNRVALGTAYTINPENPDVRAVAFRSVSGWQAAIASRMSAPYTANIPFPAPAALPVTALVLTRTAEGLGSEQRIPLRRTGRSLEVTVPAFGFVILTQERDSQ